MTTHWIDVDEARRAARTWTARADAWFRSQVEIERGAATLDLDAGAASHELLSASGEVWVNAAFVRLVVARVLAGDDATIGDAAAARDLRVRAGATVQSQSAGACATSWAAWSFSPIGGDLGETFDTELRPPYTIDGATPTERGRGLVARALADTADEAVVRPDELLLVRTAGGGYVVVLPGVTDLSRPDPGFDGRHRSVRDLDQAAYASWRSSSVDDNRYARAVVDAMRHVGVPVGARVMLVGHSFGADTALDLAADATFNGPAGYLVTHVVAAGHHAGPQLRHVGPTTEVLVLQNRRDAVVIAEAVGHGDLIEGVEARRAMLSDLWHGDLVGALAHLGDAVVHDVGLAAGVGRHVVRRRDELADIGLGVATGDPARVVAGWSDLVTLEPGVERPTDHQTVVVFDGGGRGAGHHPDHYVDHVAGITASADPAVVAFFESVDRAGLATDGIAIAIDISVP